MRFVATRGAFAGTNSAARSRRYWFALLSMAAVVLLAAPLSSMLSPAPARASARIDVAHTQRDQQRADACILDGVVIYTDPYIGGRMRHREIVANIAQMCAHPFARYAEDRALDAAAVQPVLRRIIEAGLRGQFHEDGGSEAMRDAR